MNGQGWEPRSGEPPSPPPAGKGRGGEPVLQRRLGETDFFPTWRAMQRFTADRHADTPDELWLTSHPPVFTQGQGGKPEHLLRDIGIPVVKIDRGGQITYHGPGQAVVYLLVDLSRRGLKVRELVSRIEQAVIDLLAGYGLRGERVSGAPGVYVGGAKVAALGLRVKGGCCYHGVALNVDMELAPFSAINPCGYPDLKVTRLRDLGVPVGWEAAGEALLEQLKRQIEK
ncbi:MAG: lipoyl(octanoyl) transferase LipB [Burkholderiales bacterium]|nr:octanoyltransferase [Rhodocyclaceae bacterium]MCZ2421266.1 lipoyl(octanoyl) transferase LipB [Burkholderiales bacterium]